METKLFDLVSDYQPQGDQPKAIQELVAHDMNTGSWGTP